MKSFTVSLDVILLLTVIHHTQHTPTHTHTHTHSTAGHREKHTTHTDTHTHTDKHTHTHTQLFLSFPPEDTTVSARISDCLAEVSTWMKNHHLQLNLAKTELMVFPAKQAIHHNISINIDSLSLVPSKTAKN